MRANRPSFTASVVAFGRGVGVNDSMQDELAADLVPLPFSPVLGALARAGVGRALLRPALRAAPLGLVDHAALRMSAIDDVVVGAVRDGVPQVVVLGAGLDTRAWRIRDLGRAVVFEVDHPATQAYKRERVAGRASAAQALHFVPVDFEHERVGDALGAAGHDAGARTLWVWEAVTMYLPHAATDATLAQLAVRSASGSVLAMTYATPEVVPFSDRMRALTHLSFRAFGEPLVGAMSAVDASDRVRRAGFDPGSDTGSEEWADRYGGSARLSRTFGTERLVVATRA
jgi:methyltransferase (TIGR00027 family)